MVEFQDDWETVSPSAGMGTRLLRQELDNHTRGLPPGLTAMPASRGRAFSPGVLFVGVRCSQVKVEWQVPNKMS